MPDTSSRRAQWRRAYRDVARDLHPDRGGDTGQYLARITEIDLRYGLRAGQNSPNARGLATAATSKSLRQLQRRRTTVRLQRRAVRIGAEIRTRLDRGRRSLTSR